MKIKALFTLLREVKKASYRKRETIIPLQSSAKDILFIRKGMVRVFHNSEEGDEITFQLFAENQFFSNIHSLLLDEPSKFTYEALEDTTIYQVNAQRLMDLTARNADILDLGRAQFGTRTIKQAFLRVESFVFLSPEQRYLKFKADYPNIVGRAPDMYIANVLGMTPVSLSRIRKRIADKK